MKKKYITPTTQIIDIKAVSLLTVSNYNMRMDNSVIIEDEDLVY